MGYGRLPILKLSTNLFMDFFLLQMVASNLESQTNIAKTFSVLYRPTDLSCGYFSKSWYFLKFKIHFPSTYPRWCDWTRQSVSIRLRGS